MNLIASLRPVATDPDSIRAAIARAEAAHTDAVAKANALERNMRALLLTATDAEMEQAEHDAAKAHRDAERIDALLPELRAALARSENSAAADSVRALEAEAARLAAALDAAMRKTYPAALAAVTALLVKEAEAEAALRKWTRARLDCIARGEATADDLTTPPEQPSAQLGGRDLLRNLVQMPTITGKLGAEGAICPPSDELRRGQGFGEWVEANNAQIERQAALRRQDEELTRRNNEARVRSFDRAHGPVRFAGTSPPSELNIVAGFEDDPIEPTGGAIGGDGWGAAFARAAAEGGR